MNVYLKNESKQAIYEFLLGRSSHKDPL